MERDKNSNASGNVVNENFSVSVPARDSRDERGDGRSVGRGERKLMILHEASPFCTGDRELDIRYGVVVITQWLDNSYYDLSVKRPLTI